MLAGKNREAGIDMTSANRSHRAVPGFRRWLALLLTLVLLNSGLTHFAVAGHDVSPGHDHVLVSLGDDAADGSCCHDHPGHAHAERCSMASGCFLCVPVTHYATAPLSEADAAQWTVEAVCSDCIVSILLRPPRFP
jgi:hypothetical protein